jgi:alginate O-acetyltransferase complex protein AlgJ
MERALSTWSSRLIDVVVSVGFLCAACLPLLGTIAFPNTFDPLSEKRRAADFPNLSSESIGEFPGRFEKAFADRFAFRKPLIRLASLTLFHLGVSTSPKVVLGRRGWLFYAGENEIDLHRRLSPFSPAELRAWGKRLDARRAWLSARGIRYLVVIPPNKSTIYPDMMPRDLDPLARPSRLDQLLEFLGTNSDVDVLDVRPALLDARKGEHLYSYTDTHWNYAGAFVAYRQIALRLRRWFPSLRPLERAEMIETHVWGKGGDLSALLGLSEDLPERELIFLFPAKPAAREAEARVPVRPDTAPEHLPYASEIADPTKPRAVVLGDSFMIGLRPFLAEHFERSVFLTTQELPVEVIENERPDLVIEETLERVLGRAPPTETAWLGSATSAK